MLAADLLAGGEGVAEMRAGRGHLAPRKGHVSQVTHLFQFELAHAEFPGGRQSPLVHALRLGEVAPAHGKVAQVTHCRRLLHRIVELAAQCKGALQRGFGLGEASPADRERHELFSTRASMAWLPVAR